MSRTFAVLREAFRSSLAQPVASIVTIVIVAGMVSTVLLTTGRTVGAEQAVLGTIDSAGTRSIVVRADNDAGLDTTVLDRLAHVEGIAWMGAFGPAQDVANAAIPDGTRVPVRLVWGEQFSAIGIPEVQPVPGETGWASPTALESLGMQEAVGGVVSDSGASYAIAGEIGTPDYLAFLEPLVVVPQERDTARPGAISVLVVIAGRPDLVSPVAQAVQSVLAIEDPTKATVSTSQSLAELRALVEGQLGSFGRNLVVVIFSLTAALVGAILYGLVMLRRKDFGRRRALGAPQSLIIALLLTQTGLLSIVGVTVGTLGAVAALLATQDPLPSLAFFLSIGVLAVATSLVAALLPAIAAARREPIRELRVP